MQITLIQKILNFFLPVFFHLKLKFSTFAEERRAPKDKINSNKLP